MSDILKFIIISFILIVVALLLLGTMIILGIKYFEWLCGVLW